MKRQQYAAALVLLIVSLYGASESFADSDYKVVTIK
jgi:hypothetical protein